MSRLEFWIDSARRFTNGLNDMRQCQSKVIVRVELRSLDSFDLRPRQFRLVQMCPTKMRSSFFILEFRAPEDAIAKPMVQVLRVHHINLVSSAQEIRELMFNRNDLPANRVAWFEFDQDIDVAVWAKVVSQHGAEQRQLANMISLAEVSQTFFRYRNSWLWHIHYD
jgi:hypothetical protein